MHNLTGLLFKFYVEIEGASSRNKTYLLIIEIMIISIF